MRSASDLFADLGYRNTSIRAVAAGAGCDPALVPHYFGSKEDLFDAVVADTVRPGETLREALRREGDHVAEWLVRQAVADWDDPVQVRRILGVLRSVLELPAARERMDRALLFGRLSDVEGDEVRASLIRSLFIGVLMSRHMGLIESELTEKGSGRLIDVLVPVVGSLLSEGALEG